MRITVDYAWHDIGMVRLEAGKLRFPDTPDVPGIYRYDLGAKIYIGETDRLRRRFQHYRTPGPTQPTNIRLNAIIMNLFDAGIPVMVSTITSANIEVDKDTSPLDLRQKAARLLVENAALSAAFVNGHAIENL